MTEETQEVKDESRVQDMTKIEGTDGGVVIREATPTPDKQVHPNMVLQKHTGKYVRGCLHKRTQDDYCGGYAKVETDYCSVHFNKYKESKPLEETSLLYSIGDEVIAIKKFLRRVVKEGQDPKLVNRVNDLVVAVCNLDDKIKGLLTKDQFKQAGFYFSSILFKYIQDGTRYELAKSDFISHLKALGLTVDEVKAISES